MGTTFILFVSASIFSIGAVGFLIRKNPLVMFMCVELMLNAVNLVLVGYSNILQAMDGQVFALIIMTVAAADALFGEPEVRFGSGAVAMLFPWAVAFQDISMTAFWSMMVFLGVLTIGFAYEWKKGAMTWE